MKVLVVGHGAREHAICWKLRQSKALGALFCAPGNPGTSQIAENIPLAVNQIDELVRFATENEVDLTVVGPELPLSLGLVDRFRAAGLRVFGPTQAAARLESSKSFAKEVMLAAGVRTASSSTFYDRTSLVTYVQAQPVPLVMKADGLASGKGVVVCHTRQEVAQGVEHLFTTLRAECVVVEEFLPGKEASFIVATDGARIVPLAASHDYKRLLDGNRGPNTGGMGAVSPTPVLPDDLQQRAVVEVIEPMLAEMRKRGSPFEGFLYAGLMIGPSREISVVEFNARLGDPETQVIMRRMESDLLSLFVELTEGAQSAKAAHITPLRWSERAAVCVVLASEGYPESPRSGDEIHGCNLVSMIPEVVLFHAGTEWGTTSRGGEAASQGGIVTNGGRVLSVTAIGDSIQLASSSAYKACDMVQFKGRQLRRDVGKEYPSDFGEAHRSLLR